MKPDARRSICVSILVATVAIALGGCHSSPSMMSLADQRLQINVRNECSEPLEFAAGLMALDASGKPVGVALTGVPSMLGGYQVDITLPPAPVLSPAETSRVVFRLRTVPPSWQKARVQWYEVVGGVAQAYDIRPDISGRAWAEDAPIPRIEARGLPAIRVLPVPEDVGGTDPNWGGRSGR